jgi:cysteine-rich repeat protein
VDPGEECDDGGGNSDEVPDACRTDCRSARCGDGVADTGEECDTGGDSAACDADCTPPVCGDGSWNAAAGEDCDDGNVVDGDGCESDCTAPTAANLLVNGDYSNGRTGWILHTDGAASFSVVDGEARVAVTTAGGNVQLYQKGIDLEPETEYEVAFRARHTAGGGVKLRMHRHTSPHTSFGLNRTIDLGTTDRQYAVQFTTPAGETTGARFVFWLADHDESGETHIFDDVVLRKIAGP